MFLVSVMGGADNRWLAVLLVSILAQLTQGAGSAGCNLAIFSMVTDRFPDNLSKIMGLNELVIGGSFAFGPPLGVLGAAIGGYALPFTVNSTIMLLVVQPLLLAVRKAEESESQTAEEKGDLEAPTTAVPAESSSSTTGRIRSVLSLPLLVAAGILFLGTCVFGLVQPIYARHAESFLHLNPEQMGLMFTCIAGSYSVCGMPAGALADKMKPINVIALGLITSGSAVFLLGFLAMMEDNIGGVSETVKVGVEVVCLIAMGAGQALALIPALPAMKQAAPNASLSNGEAANSDETEAVVTLFNVFQQGGLLIAPNVGGVLNVLFGFNDTVMLGGGLCALFALVGQVVLYMHFQKKSSEVVAPASNLKQPLLIETNTPSGPLIQTTPRFREQFKEHPAVEKSIENERPATSKSAASSRRGGA